MAKKLIREVAPHKILYRDDIYGLAWIEDGTLGWNISIHCSIDSSGSVQGMKNLGYWKKNDRTIKCNGFYYDIDTCYIPDAEGEYHDMERIVAKECRCQACIERRERK